MKTICINVKAHETDNLIIWTRIWMGRIASRESLIPRPSHKIRWISFLFIRTRAVKCFFSGGDNSGLFQVVARSIFPGGRSSGAISHHQLSTTRKTFFYQKLNSKTSKNNLHGGLSSPTHFFRHACSWEWFLLSFYSWHSKITTWRRDTGLHINFNNIKHNTYALSVTRQILHN